jgi:hypothetical protein
LGEGKIVFDPTVFPTGPGATAQTINLGSALTINSNVSIVGPGANLLTVSGQGQVQVFTVSSGVTASISGLTITNANAASGGGIFNDGTLTVSNSTISGNTANTGGGIANDGTVTVSNSTISGNTATAGLGGGIFNERSTSTLTVSNSTISGNTASDSGGIPGSGGGINNDSGTLTVSNSTISNNTASGSGGSPGSGGGIVSGNSGAIVNSILTGDTGGDCSGPVCPTSGTNGNVVGGAALAPLGFYGGPTQTMPPLPGSVALKAGVFQTGEPNTDQRGALRPSTANATIDAGAVQITGDAPMIGQISPGSGPTAGGTTVTITGTGFDAASDPGNSVSAVNFGVTPASAFAVTPATATAPAFVTAASPASAAGTVDITVTNNLGTSATAANDEFTYFVAVAISTATLPNATWNSGYSQPLVATGGSGSYNWTASGPLPTGLMLSGSGSNWSLSGTPSATGSFSFSLTATDTANSANMATQADRIDVLATPIVNIGLPNPGLTFGQSGTITVMLAPPTGLSIAPSGTITYSIDGGPLTTVGLSGGKASVPIATTLAASSHTVVISYSGDANYSGVANMGVTLVISQATLTITANNATKVYGTTNPAFTGTVSGQQGAFAESFATTATISSPVGMYSIVPSVTGVNLGDYQPTVIDGTLTITKAGTTISISAGTAPVTPGASVTLNAAVASATTGTPTGTVSFYDGATLLDTAMLANGAAMYSTTALASGVTHTLTAVYSGDTNFTGSTSGSAVTVPVVSLDFTFMDTGASAYTAVPGAVATYSFGLSPLNGSYMAPVNFTVSGLPAGATASFTPSTIVANGGATTVQMAVQTAAPMAQNRGDSLGSGIVLALLLLPFSVNCGMRKKLKGSKLLTVLLLVGITATMTGCGSGNGFLLQKTQTYTLTVTATSGTTQHSQTVTLMVQ